MKNQFLNNLEEQIKAEQNKDNIISLQRNSISYLLGQIAGLQVRLENLQNKIEELKRYNKYLLSDNEYMFDIDDLKRNILKGINGVYKVNSLDTVKIPKFLKLLVTRLNEQVIQVVNVKFDNYLKPNKKQSNENNMLNLMQVYYEY